MRISRESTRILVRYIIEDCVLTILILFFVETHPEPDILWNQDGSWGAYTTTSEYNSNVSLYVVKRDRTTTLVFTGEWPRLTKTSPRSDEFVYPAIERWAPDGKHVLFFKAHYMSASYGANGSPLFDADVSAGEIRKLSKSFMMDNGYPDDRITYNQSIAFSPDGKQLLLAMGNGKFSTFNKRIALYDYSTLERTWLTATDSSSFSPSWSPDGKQIVYTANPKKLPKDDPAAGAATGSFDELFALYDYQRIWIMNADGTGKKLLSHPDKQAHYPKWTAKNRIQFLRNAETGWEDEVWEVSADGTNERFIRNLEAGESNVWRYGDRC